MDVLLPSDMAYEAAAAAASEEDLLAACVDVAGSEPCLKAAAMPRGQSGGAAAVDADDDDDDAAAVCADDVEDWNLLLDTLDAFDQPPVSGHSEDPAATAGTGAMQAGAGNQQQQQQQQQQQSVQSAMKQQPGSCDDAVKAPAAAKADQGLMMPAAPVNAIVAVKAAAGPGFKHAAPDSCSPAGAPLLGGSSGKHRPASDPSATASGEGDSNSAAWHTGGPDRGAARFSWAEDNSPLLAGGGAADGATLSGANATHSPGSAEGAHSSAGTCSRAAATGAGSRSHADHLQHHLQQHQPAGSSSAADGLRAEPLRGELMAAAAAVRGVPGSNLLPQQHPAAAFMAPGRQEAAFPMALMGSHTQGGPQYAASNPRGTFQQPAPSDYAEPAGFSMFTSQGGGPLVLPAGPHQQQHSNRHLERVINQFAVPGSPIPGSPLSGAVGGVGGPFGLVASQGRFSHQGALQPQGRPVVMGAQMQQGPRHHPWPPGGPCPCCPPGLPLLPPASGPMMASGARPHLQDAGGFTAGGPLNPDWRPAPHSTPLVLHLEQDLGGRPPMLQGPGGVLPFHLAPHSGPMRTSGPSHVAVSGHMQGMPPAGGFMNLLQQQMPPTSSGAPPPPAAHAAGGGQGSFRGGAPALAAHSSGGGSRPPAAAAGAAAAGLPAGLGDIHPAALSQFGLPEESFPVMVGPPKRKRGRPRKHPLPEVAAASAAIAAAAATASAAPTGLPMGLPGHLPMPTAAQAQQHHLAMQQQQQQHQQLMQQQHQMQLRMQQQQQQRQMMMLHQVAPQGWLSVPSSQAMTAPPLAPGGGGGGVPMWAAAGAPDSPFSPGQVVALKRQKSRDFSWGFST